MDYIKKAQKLPKLTDRDNMSLNYMMGLLCKDTGDRKGALKLFKKIYNKDKNFKSVAKEIRELSEQTDRTMLQHFERRLTIKRLSHTQLPMAVQINIALLQICATIGIYSLDSRQYIY